MPDDASGRKRCHSPIHADPARCSEEKKRTHALTLVTRASGDEEDEESEDEFHDAEDPAALAAENRAWILFN